MRKLVQKPADRRSTPHQRFLTRRNVMRGVLAGAAVSVGLPFFDSMLDENGVALAGGTPLPTRFGLWFFGNGVRLDSWTPTLGNDWQPPEGGALAGLLDVKPYVSVVSGLSVKTPRHAHHSGMSAVCSGGRHLKVDDVRDTIVSTMQHPSVDQVAAAHFQATAPKPYRSLEAAVTRFRGTDEGTTFQYLSHNGSAAGETNVNPSEESPQLFFERLFGQGTVEPVVKRARRSVLNAVGDQIGSLKNKLGSKDKARLDQHLSSISDLEKRLTAMDTACNDPTAPGDFPDLEGKEQMTEKNQIMSDLITVALACGLTDAFSMMFSTCGSGVVMWVAGATDGQHYMNHTEAAPYTKQHDSVKFTMQQLGYFLGRLRDTPEGASNLLANSSILVCTEHTEGWTHSQDDLPMLVCGHGGGRLKGNVHYRDDGGNASRALLTALRGAGLPLTQFGYDEGLTDQPITELEVGI